MLTFNNKQIVGKSRNHLNTLPMSAKVLPVLVLFLVPVYALADTSGSIAVTLTYTNGDTADYWPVSLKIYQDTGQTPYKVIDSITGNPFNIVSLPINHQYKIVAYTNSMYASVTYVNLQQEHQDATIKLPLPGGMRITAFYSDDVTPIANATVVVRASSDNKMWGHSATNADGNSLRFWIEPTMSPDDHYIVDIHIGDHLVYSSSPVYLRPGIAQEIKVTTDWPRIVNSLVTVKVLNAQSHAVGSSDGKFLVDLYDFAGNKISESPVTPRGEAYFSNLKVGDYTFKVIRTDDNSEWATASMTEDGTVTSLQISPGQTPTTTGSPVQLQVPSCNCVAFRLDNVQDYWLDDVQTKIIDSFDSKDAGITVGVISKVFGSDAKIVQDIKSKALSGNVDIAINGWSFEDFTTLTKDQQENLLQESKTRLSSVLGVTPTVFMPPYDKTNNDTLYAMSDVGIQTLSTSVPPKIPNDLAEKIHTYQTSILSGVIYQNTPQDMANSKLVSNIKDSIKTNGYAIVTLNFQDYSQGNGTTKENVPDTQKMQNLQSLIDSIRDNGYTITTISNIQNMLKPHAPWFSSAQQWSQGNMSSANFLKIIKPTVSNSTSSEFTIIPGWVKHNVELQSQGLVSDDEFLDAIKYLVKMQVIK